MMKRRAFNACLLATVLLSADPTAALAQSGSNLLQGKGFVEEHNWFSPFAWEHFDAVSGNILLTFTDLALPGNAGRELRIQRVFNSNDGGVDASRWRFGFPGMVMKVVEKPDPPDNFDFNDNIFLIKLLTPVFIMADGAEHPTAYVGEPNGHTAAQLRAMTVMSGQFLKYDRLSGTLSMPDGTVCHYAPDGTTDIIGHPIWTLRDFSDPFGNTVTLTNGTDPDGTPTRTVSQGLGNGQSRQVVFRLNPDGNPSSMTFAGRIWQYQYVAVNTVLHDLQTVTPPTFTSGPAWTFAYNSPTGAISDITLPGGGHIHYDHDPRWIYDYGFPGDPNHGEEFIGITSRSMSDGATSLGTWSLGIGPSYRDVATSSGSITTPSGTTVAFSSSPTTHLNNILDGGIGSTRTTVLTAGTTIQDELLTYDMLRSVDYGNNNWWGTSELTRRDITRTETSGSHTYTTTYSYDDPNAPGTFDNYHHPFSIVENDNVGLARTTTRTYQHLGQPYLRALPTSEQTSLNNGTPLITSWTYDSSTGFRQTETVAGITTTFANDGLGNVGQATKANQKATFYTYSFGQVSQIGTSEPGYSISRAINSDGTIASETKGGRTTSYTYDDLMRVIATTPPGGPNAIATNYSNPRSLVTTRGAATTTTLLDAFGRPAATLDAAGVRTSTTYDAEGRLTFQGSPVNGADPDIGVSIEYDALARETRRTNPDTVHSFRTRAYGYDANGLPTITITDEESHSTVQTWLPFGSPDDARLVSVTDAALNTWGYGYNVAGQLTSVAAPDGTTRLWSYNTHFLLGSETHPESGTTSYTYDTAGVLATKTDANGAVFTYGYDAADRLRSIAVGNQVTRITYEPGSDNRQTTSNASTASTFLYDPAGRLQQRQDVIDGWAFTSQYVYDADDNLRATIYPSGRRIDYDVNAAHQITHVFETAAGRDYAFGMTYHASGAPASYTAGNLIATTIGYDPKRYWVTSINSGNLHLSYSDYDKVGNVKAIADSRPGFNQTFTYDVLHRLSTVAGPYGSGTYVYDAQGNWQSANGTAYMYQPGTLRLASQGATAFTYDNNGNTRTAGPTASYTYTPQNMLQSAVASGVTTSYAYDADDSRAKKSANGSTTYFLHGAGGALLTEWKDPGTGNGATRDYVYAGSRLLNAVVKTAMPNPGTACGTIFGDGSVINVTVASGQNPCFKFNGLVNQTVSALMTAVSPSTFGNSWYLRILRPNQSELTSAFTCCGNTTDFLDTVSLPTDGEYTLVADPAGTLTGSVSLQLYTVGDITGPITANGTAVNVALTTPGQRGVLTFNGAAGQIVSATMTALSPSTFPNSWSVTLVGPTGANLGSGLGCCGSSVAFMEDVTLSASGAYKLIVDPSATFTGSVAVRLYTVTHVTGPITTNGTAVAVALPTPGQNASLTFNGTQGQRVSLNGTNGTIAFQEAGCDVWVDIRTSSNAQVSGSSTCMEVSGFMEPVTLPATGVYTVLVNPTLEAVGTLTVSLYNVPSDIAGTVSVNGGGSFVAITAAGQNGRIAFAGTAGQPTTVRVTGNSIPFGSVTLLKPDNSILTLAPMAAGSFTLPTQTLSASGTYTILIDPTTTSSGSLTVAVTSP